MTQRTRSLINRDLTFPTPIKFHINFLLRRIQTSPRSIFGQQNKLLGKVSPVIYSLYIIKILLKTLVQEEKTFRVMFDIKRVLLQNAEYVFIHLFLR